MKLVDLTNKRFERLTVIKRVNNSKHGDARWLCKCDCGNQVIVSSPNLKSNHVKSCGCLAKEIKSQIHKKHGLTSTKIYIIYHSMLNRCYNKNDKSYFRYGGRGISVCPEWRKDFINFYNWAMQNGYREDLTIERINVNDNYKPDNCRWATITEQANNRRTSKYIEYKGEVHTIAEWAKIYNIPYLMFYRRLKRGWDFDKCIKTPPLKYNSKYYK